MDDGVDSPTDAATIPERVNVRPVSDDDAIRARLADILETTDWFSDPVVTVENGVVFLAGTTELDEHKNWATGLCRNTEDVVAVVNRIQVSRAINYRQSAEMAATRLETMWEDLLLRIPNIVAGCFLLGLTWIDAEVGKSVT